MWTNRHGETSRPRVHYSLLPYFAILSILQPYYKTTYPGLSLMKTTSLSTDSV